MNPRCTAKSKGTGEQCKLTVVPGRSKCRFHGGATPRGVLSANYKHGRHSKAIPLGLAQDYIESLADPKLTDMRDELAAIDSLINDRLRSLGKDGSESGANWKKAKEAYSRLLSGMRTNDAVTVQNALNDLDQLLRIGVGESTARAELENLMNLRRKVAETQHRLERDAKNMMTAEQGMAMIGAISNLILLNVTDREALARIRNGIERLIFTLRQPKSIDAIASGVRQDDESNGRLLSVDNH